MKLNYFEISSIPTVDAKKVLASIEEDEMHPGRKRRRLDNLNIDERVLRRKLKNRVAAQSARDRKKAHMDDLEITLGRIEKENKFLKKSNEELRSQVHDLMEANLQLHSKLGLTPPPSPSKIYTCLTVQTKDRHQIITPSVCDHDHIVIKREESSTEHASLNLYSLLWNLVMTILVLLIRICEKSPRLNYFLTLLVIMNLSLSDSTSSQETILSQSSQSSRKKKSTFNKIKSVINSVLSPKNLMLMTFCRAKWMSLLARRAQSLNLRHLVVAKLALISMSLSNCAQTMRPAWWGTQPIMDLMP